MLTISALVLRGIRLALRELVGDEGKLQFWPLIAIISILLLNIPFKT